MDAVHLEHTIILDRDCPCIWPACKKTSLLSGTEGCRLLARSVSCIWTSVGKRACVSGMPDDLDTDLPEPDLAQLLVLEAGRMLEDLTLELAMRLSRSAAQRGDHLTCVIATLERVRALLAAAHACKGLEGESIG